MIEQAPTVASLSPASGPATGGTTVTIHGTGFYPGSTVDFGATTAASVTYVSSYELEATAPAGTGTVDVTVTTGEGSSATSAADRFSYTTPPATTTVPKPLLRSGGHTLEVSGRSAGVPLVCSVARCHGTLRVEQQVVVRVHHGKKTIHRKKTITLASAHYTLAAGRHLTLRVRLDATALKALAKAKRHRLSARVSATVTGGSTLTERVTLLKPASRHRAKRGEPRILLKTVS